MKHEWKKQEKGLYGAKQIPAMITVPVQNYIMTDGKVNPLYEEIRFDTMQDGKCIEILHIGAFDDEPASFEKMAQFAEKNNLKRDKSCHREIYLNNVNRVKKTGLKPFRDFQSSKTIWGQNNALC